MERTRSIGMHPRSGLALAVPALALLFAAAAVEAQPGGPQTYTIRVVDQAGRPLDGSLVRIEGATGDLTTPATVELDAGPQLVTVAPAAQGAMLPGGWARPTGPNGLSRNEFMFFGPMGGEVLIEWRTAEVQLSVDDPSGTAIAGAQWSFAGDGAALAPGALLLPVTDESLYPTLAGGSVGGWWFDVRAAFGGAAVDLVHGERHEAVEGATTLSLRWQQAACTMGVVDGGGQAIRGATFTILGRTFDAGDPITLPSTDEALYPDLAGTLAGGFPATLFTNTAAGTGNGTFEVLADGSLTPPFVDVNGGSFGLRCGVDPFPPITTGTLVVRVTADGAPFAGAQVAWTDAQGGAGTLATDAAGEATQNDVAQGPATLTLTVPAGHHAVDPASGSQGVTIVAGSSTVATFTIALDETPPPPPPPPVVNHPETWNYWKREVAAAIKGRGHHEESLEDMAVKYPEEIFTGFAQHPTDPVRVEGVTQVDPDGNGPKIARRLDLADMDATLEANGSDATRGARRELLVLLLNVVSGRLSLHLVVDAAGTTLEQEIRRLAAMINDGQPANDRVARNAAQRINAGRARWGSPAYSANGGTASLVYGDANPDAVLDGAGAEALALTATRAPGGAGVRLSFTLATPQRATLDVFDASGRRQARLYEGDAPAGTTAMTWTAAGGRPGVYFARLLTPAGTRSAKVIASR